MRETNVKLNALNEHMNHAEYAAARSRLRTFPSAPEVPAEKSEK